LFPQLEEKLQASKQALNTATSENIIEQCKQHLALKACPNTRMMTNQTFLSSQRQKISPTDNAFIESFNGRLRQECLNQNWFLSVADARETIENWRQDYNEYRPHRSLSQQTQVNLWPIGNKPEPIQKPGFLNLEMVQ